jgi:RNA polymerase sigma-70 factor (ECF subfamily)
VRQFFALATQHVRWQLNDLARRLDEQPDFDGFSGPRPRPAAAAPASPPTAGACWGRSKASRRSSGRFFELVRIQGLTYAEAAEVVGVSAKTVQRRLNRARLLLTQQLADLCPATSGGSLKPPGNTSAP